MFSDTTLARPYAKALFDEAGLCEETAVQWEKVLTVLALIATDTAFQAAYHNPSVSTDTLIDAVLMPAVKTCLIAQSQSIQASIKNFVCLLFEHKRFLLAPCIQTVFDALVLEHKGVVLVQIFTAAPLEQKAPIISWLEGVIKSKVLVKFTVDPSVQGGLVVKAQEKVLDASLRGRLNRLYRSLKQA